MTTETAQSSRIFVRYAGKSANCFPTEEDVRKMFSVHGLIVDVDRRSRFCFVEYDTVAAAQKAVDAENGRDYEGTTLKVEIAVGARKVKSSDAESSSTVQTSAAEKKSSFAADLWLAQRDAGKKIEVRRSEQDEVLSQDVGELNTMKTMSDCSSTMQSAGPKQSRPDWQERPKTSANDSHLATETVKLSESYKRRSRSRSPLHGAQSKVEAYTSRKSGRSQSPSAHSRRLEERREWLLKQYSASNLPSAESTRTAARPSVYVSERESSSRRSSSYDRQPWPPLPSSGVVHEAPLKSAMRKHASSVEQRPAGSSELYSAAYSREQDALSSIQRYQQINRNAYYLSQMRNTSQYGGARAGDMQTSFDDARRDTCNKSNLDQQRNNSTRPKCEIFVRNNTSYSDYIKHLAVRIERIGLLVHTSMIPADADIMDEVAKAMDRGCLFALSLTGYQSSSTLYILHGQPEEHRNMLLDDAVVMLTKSFAEYSRGETKQSHDSSVKPASAASSLAVPSAPSTAVVAIPALGVVAERLRPDAATRRLIGLLSADCELTHGELEHIISYLKFRQTALVSRRALSPDSSSSISAQHSRGYVTDTASKSADDNARLVVNSLMLEVAKLTGRP